SGSSAIEVRWPAMEKERFSMAPAKGLWLFTEGVEAHDLFAAALGSRRIAIGCFGPRIGFGFFRLTLIRGGGRVELQAELHAGVEETLYRREGDVKHFRLPIEAQSDLEGTFGDLEIPILVLQDDGHFLV